MCKFPAIRRFYPQANMRPTAFYTMSFCQPNLPQDQPPDTYP